MVVQQKPVDEIEVQFVKGVGERRARLLSEVGISTVEDLLLHVPRRYLDRSTILPINKLSTGEETTVIGKVVKVEMVKYPRRRLEVTIYDRTGILTAVWFNQVDFFSRLFKKDQEVAFSGKVGFFRGWQMVHPDFDIIDESKEPLHTGQIIPLYSTNQQLRKIGLASHGFRRIIHNALEKYRDAIAENLSESLLRKYRLLSRAEAFYQIHFPDSMEQVKQAWRRFKYEELFYLELLMALRHALYRSPVQGVRMETSGELIRRVLDRLPFQLTNAQRRVLREIYTDLKSGHPMNRLLQGDVGSGKTVVALITALIAAENGYQTAFMAPTEILAEQHYLNIVDLLQGFPIRVALLIGSLSPAEKAAVQEQIRNDEVHLVIGTHALIQEKVEFKKLGLVIIDEQHRFGVLQRGELVNKGWNPHLLVMTATPIPRTLALTLYGDLDVSVIDEMPPGRQPIKTVWRTEKKLPAIYQFIREKVAQGDQAYIIYPLIEESEKIDLKAATESYEHLRKKVFPEFRLALLHGRLSNREKEAVMAQFKSGEIQILVSTTVVEVGVDVPNATILLIEHAERFGLSQLHQLRGRVGRGRKKSYCILVTPEEINEVARKRMELLERTSDGFVIAEEDLKLRGSGEFFGTRQHGLPDLRFANLVEDQKIIQAARQDAFRLVEKDPHLRLPENQSIRHYFRKKYAEKFKIVQIS